MTVTPSAVRVLVIAIALVFLFSVIVSAFPPPPPFKLSWSEEFDGKDGSPPNPAIWNRETGGSGWGNDEEEYYTNSTDNSFLQDGNLVIRPLYQSYMQHNYTSARIDSEQSVQFQYGHIAARIRAPAFNGSWAAFWMLGSSISKVGWPRSGEIDIYEQVDGRYRGGNDLQYGTLHYSRNGINNTNADHVQNGGIIRETDGSYWSDEYHVYEFQWNASTLCFLVDDVVYHNINLTGQVGLNSFRAEGNPFFFVINFAIGGFFPGFQIDDAAITRPGETCRKFACLYVDWIRVYQKPSESTLILRTPTDEAATKHESALHSVARTRVRSKQTAIREARDMARAEIAAME